MTTTPMNGRGTKSKSSRTSITENITDNAEFLQDRGDAHGAHTENTNQSRVIFRSSDINARKKTQAAFDRSGSTPRTTLGDRRITS